jgi:DNA replication protein DnaC
MKKCWAESYCKAFNDERSNCSRHCIGYVQLNRLYELSYMPLKYQHGTKLVMPVGSIDRPAYEHLNEWKKEVGENIREGKGLYIWSTEKGTGKTSWSCNIMNEYFKQVAIKNNMKCRGLFVSVPDFFKRVRESFNEPSVELNEMIGHIRTADIVIWDDILAEKPSAWVAEQLYILINHREGNLLSNIFTSNLPPEAVGEKLDERIESRIKGQCDVIEFKGADKR